MLFTEGRFFVLFAVAFGVYWSLRSNCARKIWILACSDVFYGAWNWRFLGLMYASITIDYTMGRLLGMQRPPGGRRLWVVVSIVANLSFLGFFKYYGFFVDSAIELLRALGFSPHPRTLQFVLPAGISFYTFESMSYTIDIYRRQAKAVRSYLDFAFFISFFPHLVAGPIVRPHQLFPQLETKRLWRNVDVRACCTLFLVGFFKKAVIADNVASVCDPVFHAPAAWDAASHWSALLLYHVQLYCDFSGYTDMALATAGLLGYRLPPNFDFPHLARSVIEWWSKWHMSLTSWVRDYLYIPLGGNRLGTARTYLNLYIVYFLFGLWHGGSWNMVVFGLTHGTLLALNRAWRETGLATSWLGRVLAPLSMPITTFCLLLTWPVFRGEGLAGTGKIFAALAGHHDADARTASAWWLVLFAVLAIVHAANRRAVFGKLVDRLPHWAYAVGWGSAFAITLLFVAQGYRRFIYFQF